MIPALSIAIVLALWARAAGAEEDRRRWTAQDTAWQLAYTAVVVVDWGQTLDIAARCEDRGVRVPRETNPILGRCPSNERVNALIPAAIVGHAAVSLALPRPYRRYWQLLWLGVEGHATWRNYRVGLSLRF